MNTENMHSLDKKELKKHWGWLVALGLILLILGIAAISASVTTTIISMSIFGWLLVVGGLITIAQIFWQMRGWSGFLLTLLIAVLYIVLGFMIIANPTTTAQALTLLVAFFLIFGGIFRIATAIAARSYNWGWLLFTGIISLLLGIAIWRHWPYSGLWVIGLVIGIEMLLNGWWLLMLGLVARRIPK